MPEKVIVVLKLKTIKELYCHSNVMYRFAFKWSCVCGNQYLFLIKNIERNTAFAEHKIQLNCRLRNRELKRLQ